MKKYLNILVAVMLAAVSFGLTGCGSDDDEPVSIDSKDLIGTWECDLVKAGVEAMSDFYESGEELMQFRADGTVVAVDVLVLKDDFVFDGEKVDIDVTYGTWRTDGNKIIFDYDDEPEIGTFKVKGNKLELTSTSPIVLTLTFTKVSDSRINKYL